MKRSAAAWTSDASQWRERSSGAEGSQRWKFKFAEILKKPRHLSLNSSKVFDDQEGTQRHGVNFGTAGLGAKS
ncbi:MAG: hypothetical protein R3C68_11825 [Myxococcota bacterium]